MAKTNIAAKEDTQTETTAIRDSLRDLCQVARVLGTALRRLYPSPVTDELLQVVERRVHAITDRLGSE
jgi:hypothetical protein